MDRASVDKLRNDLRSLGDRIDTLSEELALTRLEIEADREAIGKFIVSSLMQAVLHRYRPPPTEEEGGG